MTQHIETVIIGGGQGGLATSYHLTQRGREHLVLEQAAQPANAWRNDRWDSFTFVTPNWSFRLPGAEYEGDDPHGFMARDQIIERFERYVEQYRLPVHYGVRVTAVEPHSDRPGWRVQTEADAWEARNVVVATGLFQQPRVPSFSANLAPQVTQLHSGQYRNPAALPDGAVLVVGSAQSGCQIVEELYQSGRRVYLCTGSAGRAPRRYRGKDIYEWLTLTGYMDRTVEKLPAPQARFAGNPQVTGKDGGHALNLHQFARDGVVLLGRFQGGSRNKITLAGDLLENLEKTDRLETEIVKMIDDYIARASLDAPKETLPQLRDGYAAQEIRELDFRTEGISAIVWALGYTFDFGLVKAPIFDDAGFPVQHLGVTSVHGLYFAGLPWMNKQQSGLLLGVGEQAEVVAAHIAGEAVRP